MKNQTQQTELDGECVVVPDGGAMPPLCIICGTPTQDPPIRYAFTWNPHGLKMGKTTGIPMVITNRRGRLWVSYCANHRPHTLRNFLIFMLISAAGWLSLAWCIMHGREYPLLAVSSMFIGMGSLAGGLIYVAIPPLMLKCVKIEDGRLWIRPEREKVRVAFRNAQAADTAQKRK